MLTKRTRIHVHTILVILIVVYVQTANGDLCSSYIDADDVSRDSFSCPQFCCGTSIQKYCCNNEQLRYIPRQAILNGASQFARYIIGSDADPSKSQGKEAQGLSEQGINVKPYDRRYKRSWELKNWSTSKSKSSTWNNRSLGDNESNWSSWNNLSTVHSPSTALFVGAISGIVLVSLIVVAVIIFVCVYFCKRKFGTQRPSGQVTRSSSGISGTQLDSTIILPMHQPCNDAGEHRRMSVDTYRSCAVELNPQITTATAPYPAELVGPSSYQYVN